MSVASKVFRLRSAVALVRDGDVLEFFDSNERVSVRIEIPYGLIVPLLQEFDGVRSVSEAARLYVGHDLEELENLICYLNEKFVLIEVDLKYNEQDYEARPRLYNHLESFFNRTSDVLSAISMLDEKRVLVIGAGGVGSWVIQSMASIGVKNVIIMDDDIVELSNIHRQDFFRAGDAGRLKSMVIAESVRERYEYSYCAVPEKLIGLDSLRCIDPVPDLIVNCADWPSVDSTSRLVSDYCMPLEIPHVIGGGYNLHLTLVGQAVVPGKSACFNCFDKFFNRESSRELFGVKKLYRESRKIGSLGPVCSISASLTALECVKILLGVPLERVSIINRRLEFNLSTMDFSSTDIPGDMYCGSCGWRGSV